MNQTTSIAPIVQIQGAQFTETGLILQNTDERTLREAGAIVMRLRKAIDWCLGDVTATWLKFITAKDRAQGIKPETERQARQLELNHIAEYADAYDMNRDVLADHESLARFFPQSMRRPALTFQHHAEAFAGCDGDLAVANEWLGMAESKSWTVAELRAFIRRQKAVVAPDADTDPVNPDLDRKVGEIELWAAKRLRLANDLSPASARVMLAQLRRTVELIETLTRRAHGE